MKNEPNITYLLGAGASANSMPIVNDLKEKFDIYYNYISTYLDIKNNSFHNNYIIKIREHSSFFELHLESLKRYFDDMENFLTIDSYAKYLFLTNQADEYKDLKYNYSIFFTMLQIFNFNDLFKNKTKYLYEKIDINFFNHNKKLLKIDKRYLKLLATILIKNDDDLKLPNNIKFLSWNYDNQLELALRYFNILNNNSQDGAFPTKLNETTNNIVLKHLNGACGISNHSNFLDVFFSNNLNFTFDNVDIIYRLVDFYKKNKVEIINNFNFAWEDNNLSNNLLNDFEQKISNTEYLIVIGYSFPDFNVEFDKALFDKIKKNLKGIYIQNTNEDIINDFIVKMNMNSHRNRIHFSKNIYEFLTPYSITIKNDLVATV